MKRHTHIITLMLLFSSIVFLGCNKSDIRERYVGLYNLNIQGILNMDNPNGAKRNVTWELTNQRLSIEKQPKVTNGLTMKGYYECNATIDNSYIYGEPFTLTDTIDGIRMTLDLIPSKGFLNGDGVLTFDIVATGTAYYEQGSFPIEGGCHNTATKL